MPDMGREEIVSRKMMAILLIGGSLGAIIMSWIAYFSMVRQAL